MRYAWGMQDQRYPTDQTDRQWQSIVPLIPPPKAGGRPRRVAMRQVINAILYIVVTGAKGDGCCPQSIRRWRDDGTWKRIHETLRAQVRLRARRHKQPTADCSDSQSVKTTQVSGVRGSDKGKNVTGRKRHLLVDTMGYSWQELSQQLHCRTRRVREAVCEGGRRMEGAAQGLGGRHVSGNAGGLDG